jgi:hypothetical protein
MVGDWFQQKPVKGSPLFEEPVCSKIKNMKDMEYLRLCQLGYIICQSINCVVVLTLIERPSDGWFPEFLNRLRIGAATEADLNRLNETCYYNHSPLEGNSSSSAIPTFDGFFPFITSSHSCTC